MKRACDERLKEFEAEQTIFQGKPAKRFLRHRDNEQWI